MCGRFTLTSDLGFLVDCFQIHCPIGFQYEHRLDSRIDQQTIMGLLEQYPHEQMTYYEVSVAVNLVKNESKDLLIPVGDLD